MYQSKLIRLYRSLSKAELRQFKKWVYSPIHNRHEEVQQLFEYLWSKKPLEEKHVERHRLFKQLYPNQAFHMPRLRHLASFATEVLEDFIGYVAQQKYHKNNAIAFYTSLQERNLTKEVYQQERQLTQSLEEDPLRNEAHYRTAYALETAIFERQTRQQQPVDTNLQNILHYSTIQYLLSLLRHACISLTHQNLYKTTYQLPLLEPALKLSEEPPYSTLPSIQVYAAGYQALVHPDDESHYLRLRDHLWTAATVLPHEEFKEVYSIAINYCIKRLNTGGEPYIREAFELYSAGLEQGVLLQDGYLSHIAFKNMVSLGLHLERFETVRQLLDRGSTLLRPHYQPAYLPYNEAQYSFAVQEYDRAIDQLQKVVYDDLFMEIGARLLLSKIYAAQAHDQLLEAHLHSFTQFIRRKANLSAGHKERFLATIRFTQKVTQAYTTEQKEALRTTIEETAALPEKRWLLEQLA